jgi:pilus assembly protein CpaE
MDTVTNALSAPPSESAGHPAPVAETAPAAKPKAKAGPLALAYVGDGESEAAVSRSLADLGIVDGHVKRGNIDNATDELAQHGSPRFLIVDVSGLDDPMTRVSRLAEVCDPTTDVVVIGDRNDIVLYREMKAAGVSEYFFKPVVSAVLSRVLGNIATGKLEQRTSRTGKLVVVLGVRGGVGTTTIATQAAWHLAEERQRRVLLLDLDLQLDATPSHALRVALDHPDRVDELFLDRGVTDVTSHLGLFAALEPLSEGIVPDEAAVMQLLGTLMQRYRYIIVDTPMITALKLPKMLQLASTILLVSDGSLISAREVLRWRQRIGPNTSERATLHILNKKGADGALPDEEFIRGAGQPADFSIGYDHSVAKASLLGTKALYENSAMKRGLAPLVRELAGVVAAKRLPFWRRVFG